MTATPGPRRCWVGHCYVYVDPEDGFVETRLPDGAKLVARAHRRGALWTKPGEADAYEAMAQALGYAPTPEDAERMNLEHDPLHTYVCVALLGRDESPVLRAIASHRPAHSTRSLDVLGWEERLVQAVQLWLNTGRETEPLSHLWWLGMDPDETENRLRGWVEGRLGGWRHVPREKGHP